MLFYHTNISVSISFAIPSAWERVWHIKCTNKYLMNKWIISLKKYKTLVILIIRIVHMKIPLLDRKWSLLLTLLLPNIVSHQTAAPHSQTHRQRCWLKQNICKKCKTSGQGDWTKCRKSSVSWLILFLQSFPVMLASLKLSSTSHLSSTFPGCLHLPHFLIHLSSPLTLPTLSLHPQLFI